MKKYLDLKYKIGTRTYYNNYMGIKKYYSDVLERENFIIKKCQVLEGDVIHDILTFSEMKAIVEACKKQEDKLLLLLLYSTGLRIGEV